MPPALPARYRLELRLERDGDIEQWLATDTVLERAVVIRYLAPDTDRKRTEEFLDGVRAAAAVSHPHLEKVFAAEIEPVAHAVVEWNGGLSLQDRITAGETVDLEEFAPNASGLASALAELHERGTVHGAIDETVITYAVSHPAKLGGLGRKRRTTTATDDVIAMARALRHAILGRFSDSDAPLAEIVDGVSPALDRALSDGAAGLLDARTFADALAAAPTTLASSAVPRRNRRILALAGVLVVLAIALLAVGRSMAANDGGVLVAPASTPAPTHEPSSTTTSVQALVTEAAPASTPVLIRPASVVSYDPFGGGGESDRILGNLTDGDLTTTWRTELYQDPIHLLKPGVGVAFDLPASPRLLTIANITPGSSFKILFSPTIAPDLSSWQVIAEGRSVTTAISIALPHRPPGEWLIWLTDLPRAPDGTYVTSIGEVRFSG